MLRIRPDLHRAEPGLHPELWGTLPQRRADRHGFCGIGSEPGDEQADGQETANAMESARSASLVAGSNRGLKRGFRGMLPRLVSRFPVTTAEGGCMTPRNLSLSPGTGVSFQGDYCCIRKDRSS